MNIDDVAINSVPGNIMEAIKVHRDHVRVKYDQIEARNGAPIPQAPYHIDNAIVQMRIKDLFWRCTEELAEAVECLPKAGLPENWAENWGQLHPDIRHFYEEVADAFHFFAEAAIVGDAYLSHDDMMRANIRAGTPEGDCSASEIKETMLSLIVALGLSANCLKNKPWKQTQMMTDRNKFTQCVAEAWKEFGALIGHMNFGLPDFYVLAMKKGEVNKFRQRSNY